MDWILSPINSYKSSVPQNVTKVQALFRVKMRSLGQALIQFDWCPYKKGKFDAGRTSCEHKDNHLKATDRGLKQILTHSPQKTKQKAAHTLISNFWSSELWDGESGLFKAPAFWRSSNNPWKAPY